MRRCFQVLALAALYGGFCGAPALAAECSSTNLQWNSMPQFIGQRLDPANGNTVLVYQARIEAQCPDTNGYIEVFYSSKPFYQESYADVESIRARSLCDTTGSASCVQGKPGWHEYLDSRISVH